jgi:putative aldouronate transport system permease protein
MSDILLPQKLKRRVMKKKFIEYKLLYLLLVPGLIIMLFMNYLPMFGTLIAFKEIDYAKGLFGSPWIGFKNFEFLFKTNDAWIILRNTLGYNSLFIISGPIVSISTAIMLEELTNRRGAKIYQTIIILPHFISMVVISYLAFAFMANKSGFINHNILQKIGIEPISWYFEPKYWPYILFLVNGWKHWGYGTVIYLATMSGFDPQLYEAAALDGAGRFRQIISITVPLLMPITIIVFVLSVGRIFYSDFGLFYHVPRDSGMLYSVTQTLDTYTYRALLKTRDTGMAAAAAFFQSMIGFITILSANLVVKKVNPNRALF